MRDHYDFSNGVRGKYTDRYKEGTNVVLLDPDVAKEFPNSAAVNEALRQVLRNRNKEHDQVTGCFPAWSMMQKGLHWRRMPKTSQSWIRENPRRAFPSNPSYET